MRMMAVNQKYRKYSPGLPVSGHAPAWWKYAYTAIVEDTIRPYSWERISRVRYVEQTRSYQEIPRNLSDVSRRTVVLDFIFKNFSALWPNNGLLIPPFSDTCGQQWWLFQSCIALTAWTIEACLNSILVPTLLLIVFKSFRRKNCWPHFPMATLSNISGYLNVYHFTCILYNLFWYQKHWSAHLSCLWQGDM